MNKEESFKVLARKYRPQKFEDLIGQDILVEILTNAISSERIAHAYLLTGVRGVGKTTTARLIAMSINCKERKLDSCEPCSNCESCLAVKSDNNLDVIEMDAASNTGVDDIREIIENIKYKPVIAKYKIFIVDEVHMLSKSAFNALLKTLEEPPEHVKFIFATTEVKKIPITVLSRCQRFDLHRIESKVLFDHLKNIANMEQIKIQDEALALVVRAADGSVRDALSLLDQSNTNKNNEINEKTIINLLGLSNREEIFNLLNNILNGNTIGALKVYKNLYDLGADINLIFDEMLNVVHFLTQIKINPELEKNIYIPEIERTHGIKLTNNLSLNSLNMIWQILFKGYQELQSGIHLYQHGEMIILRLIYLSGNNEPEDLVKNINSLDKKSDYKAEKINQTSSNKKIGENNIINFESSLPLKNLDVQKNKNTEDKHKINSFRQFVELFYKKREAIIHTNLYNNVTLISFKEGEVTLNTEKISDENFNRNVAKLISTWTGRIWQINSSSSNIGKSLYDEDLIIMQKDIESMHNNNKIKEIMKQFPKSKIHSITDLTEIENDKKIINTPLKKEQ